MVTDRLQILSCTTCVDWLFRARRATRLNLDGVFEKQHYDDAVHPRSGKFQTNLATVQEYMVHSEKVASWRS